MTAADWVVCIIILIVVAAFLIGDWSDREESRPPAPQDLPRLTPAQVADPTTAALITQQTVVDYLPESIKADFEEFGTAYSDGGYITPPKPIAGSLLHHVQAPCRAGIHFARMGSTRCLRCEAELDEA